MITSRRTGESAGLRHCPPHGVARSGDARRHARQRPHGARAWSSARRATWPPNRSADIPADRRPTCSRSGRCSSTCSPARARSRRASTWAVMDATMHVEPPSVAMLKPGTPPRVAQVVTRALAKDPDARFADGREMHAGAGGGAGGTRADRGRALRHAAARWPSPRSPPWRSSPRGRSCGSATASRSSAGCATRPFPRFGRLSDAGDPTAAYRLAQRALATLPDDPQLQAAWDAATNDIPVTSEPTGAEVSIRALSGKDEGWIVLGTTPLTARVPFGQMRWRFALSGYDPREVIPNPFPEVLTLAKTGSLPPGMVQVPAGEVENPSENGVGGAAGVLDRRHRGDQPAVQGVRGRRRLPEAGVLDAAVRQGRQDAVVGRGDGGVPRRHRAGPARRPGRSARSPKGPPTHR